MKNMHLTLENLQDVLQRIQEGEELFLTLVGNQKIPITGSGNSQKALESSELTSLLSDVPMITVRAGNKGLSLGIFSISVQYDLIEFFVRQGGKVVIKLPREVERSIRKLPLQKNGVLLSFEGQQYTIACRTKETEEFLQKLLT